MELRNGDNTMQDTIDIRTIVNILTRKLVWILAATLTGLLLMFYISKYAMTPMYTSNIQLYVATTDTSQSVGNKGQLDLNRSLVSTYIVLLESRDSLKLVASELSTALDAKQVGEYVKMSAVNNTEILKIEAITPDPVLSAEICNAFAKNASKVIEARIKDGYVSLIDTEAVIPTKPSSPNVMLFTVIGAFLGFVLSCGVILLIHYLDNTVKSGDEVTQKFGIPILGEVPSLTIRQKGGYRYATEEEV